MYDLPRPDTLYAYCVSLIVFDSAVLVLTLVRVVPARHSHGLTPLITHVLKDGVQYFVIIFLIAIVDVICIKLAPAPLTATLLYLYPAITPTLCSRLILNLRGSILRPASNEQDTTVELHTLAFINHPEDPTIATRDLMNDIEDLEDAA